MELNNERELQGITNGSKEDDITLSEDALRQLSKASTVFIPTNVGSLEEGALGYGFAVTRKESTNRLQDTFSPRYIIYYRPLAQHSFLSHMGLPP